MSLTDSLLSAIVRADGDALVMHVGERPYVVVGANTVNISTHGLNLDAMTQMLAQLLPAESQAQLEEFGAVEYRLPDLAQDRFNVVAARGGDDVWIEIRRRRHQHDAATAQAPDGIGVAAASAGDGGPEVPQAAGAVAIADFEPEVPQVPGANPSPELSQPPERANELAQNAEPDPVVIEWAAAADAAPAVGSETADDVPWSLAAESEPVASQESAVADAAPSVEPAAPVLPAANAAVAESYSEEVVERVELNEEATGVTTVASAARVDAAEPEKPSAPSEPAKPEEPVEPADAASPGDLVGAGEPVPAAVTRTVRIEVPPRVPAATHVTDVERLLRVAAARGASALVLQTDSKPYLRVDGDIRALEAESLLTRSAVELAINEIAPGTGHDGSGQVEPGEWLKEYADLGRVRCSTFTDHRGPGLMLRLVATRAATAEQLGLSPDVCAFATEAQGLVIVAGQRASGKSTLLSALVDLINRQRAEYVITLENQIQLVHENRSALISQREVRGGEKELLAAAHAALRERPDVLVLDDLVSPHMVPLALTAASEGVLILLTVAAPSTADAVQRFVELASAEIRPAVHTAMADAFRGAVAQVLLKKSGGGLVTAREVLLATAPVSRLIHDGQLAQLPQALDAGRQFGMVTFDETLVEYVRGGIVDPREAFRKAPDRDRLLTGLRREGVDTRLVERLV